MIIEKMEIKKYKGAENLVLHPKKLTAITGNIGTGKSSILEAIRFGVTGIADTPQQNAEVNMTILGGKEILWRIRSGNKSVKLEKRVTTQEKVKQFLEDNAGVNMDCMKVVTSAKLIAGMNSGSFCEFLVKSGLIPLTMTFDDMVRLCEIGPMLAKSLTEYLPQAVPFSLTEVESAYKAVYDARTALNREIALISAQAQFDGEKLPRSAASIEYELSELLSLEEKQRTYKILMDKYQKDLQNQKRIRQEIADIEEKIRDLRSKGVIEPDASEKARLQSELANVKKQLEDLVQTSATIAHTLAVQEKMFAELTSSVCPLSNKLTCSTDKTQIRSEIEGIIKELTSEKEKAASRKNILEKRKEDLEARIAELDSQLEEFLKLQSLFNTRKALMDSMPVVSEPPVAPEFGGDIAVKKSALQTEKNKADAYARSVTAKRRLNDLNRRLNILEQMLEVLAPKSGLREKIIASVLEPLEKHCNDLADKLRLDFKLSIQVKNGVTILCKPKSSVDFVGLTDVSTGEQTLAMFLILDMLNQLSGLGLLMMDNLDALDAYALDELMTVLTSKEVLDRYDHIFVSMVAHDDSVNVLDKHRANIDQFIGM